MRQTTSFVLGFLVCIAFTAQSSRAQYTTSFQTNIISGVSSNWSGYYYVGNTFSGDALLIQSNGVLTSGSAYLGYSPTSSNNSALVTDSGSIWSNGFFFVGCNGFGNSLAVSNGAQVINNGEAWVSQGNVPLVTSNRVVITGTGSVWSNGQDLSIGDPGACNRVIINNGGLLIDYRGFVGSYADGSSNNSVVVSDPGSMWTNNSDVYVGYSGAHNSLTVSNGGKAFGGYGYVGYSGTNNVTVTGSGSLWTNSSDLNIGYSGARNSLAILNSGAVYNIYGYIGNNATAASNSVTVSGTGSVWRTIGALYVGNSGGGNSLVISNGGRLIDGAYCYVGNNSGTNSVLVSDPGSVWNSSMYTILYLGYSGAGNSLVISNGGRVLSDQGTVGLNASSTANCVLITGPGSVWSNSGTFCLGYSGFGNNLVISNGGKLFDSTAVLGNSYGTGSNNAALVSGTGSVWNCSSGLSFGGGRSNTLVINDGGLVVDSYAFLASDGGRQNSAWVTGAGSVWSNTTSLYIDYDGSATGNSLVISNSGKVIDQDAYEGYAGNSNTVSIVNGGVWQNNTLAIGYFTSGNSLVVAGGTVLATNLVIGTLATTCDNFIELESGSVAVTNATQDAVLEVRNGLLILNGGTLQADILVMTNGCGRIVPQGGTLLYKQLVLDPNLSALGDGIPNGWKQQYGFDPLDPAVASADADGDGFNNLQEYLAGFNPTNAAGYLHVISAATTNSNDVVVTYLGASGDTNYVPGVQSRTNVLDFTTGDASGNYTNGSWQDTGQTNILGVGISAAGGEGTGLGTVTNMTDFGGATNVPSRYYRVRVLLP
jgi:T5SS/PEP-CTERM-associated repeat protein